MTHSLQTRAQEPLVSKVVKRKYSRSGCTECKKRRMKCDENKPKCWQCDRLGRDCIYIINAKNKKRRQPTTKKNTTEVNGSEDAESNHTTNNSQECSPIQLINGISSNVTASSLSQDQINGASASQQQPPAAEDFDFVSLKDFNSLYNDLNDLVNWRLEQTLTPNLQKFIETNDDFSTTFSKIAIPADIDQLTTNDDHVPRTYDNKEIFLDLKFSEFQLGEPHMEYLSIFYHKFSNTLCPFQPQFNINPIRDVLLHYSKRDPYILYAILATGSRLKHKEKGNIQDDQAFCSYLSSCLNILGENFENESLILERIESMLLTILLLTSDCGSSRNIRWRAHLRGAKELLKKSSLLKVNTDVLNLCKNWLICYEVLAGLTNPYGGIFQDDLVNEIDQFVINDDSYLQSLIKFQMIQPNSGFNLMSGHLIQLDLIFKKIIIIKNKLRNYQGDDFFLDFTEDLVPINEVLQLLTDLTNVEKQHIAPSSNSSNNIILNNNIPISLMDITNHCHIQAAKLIILTEFMKIPPESTIIHQAIQSTLSYLSFLQEMDFQFDNLCLTHLHFVMVVLGKSSSDHQHQVFIQRVLTRFGELGLDSAYYNLNKLESLWNGVVDDGEDEDILTW